jgi:type IV pilus assembly protein PilC
VIDYVYKAQDQTTGEIIHAEVQADSPESAAKVLAQQKLFPLEITEKDSSNLFGRLGIKRRIGFKDRVLFTRQLATLLSAGLPIARALRTAHDQVNNPELKSIVNSVVVSVEGGSSLAEAFAQYPKQFNEIYVALVAAGEASGKLEETLQRLATQQEKEAAIISKIRGALIYPAIVFLLISAVLIFMLVTIVPEVSKLYVSLKIDLPILTQILLLAANFIKGFWYLVIVVGIGLFIGGRRLLATDEVQMYRDKLVIKLPLFGVLFEKLYMARFARTMGTLLASGVPMLQAMSTTQHAVSNRLVEEGIEKATDQVKGGKALSESLEDKPGVLALVPQMIKIGEESGAIDDMLMKIATYYEDEVDEAIKNLTTTLEPIIMIVLGGMVMFILGAVLFPIYSLVGSGALNNLK